MHHQDHHSLKNYGLHEFLHEAVSSACRLILASHNSIWIMTDLLAALPHSVR